MNRVRQVLGALMVLTAGCLSTAATGEKPAEPPTADYILCPAPQQIDYQNQYLTLDPDKLIWLGTMMDDSALATGRILQQAVADIGAHWAITAAEGKDDAQLGMMVRVDPLSVSAPEGYQILIDQKKIQILAHDSAGAFYAAQTLRQIARQAKGAQKIRCLKINDWPDFAHRGVTLDISRDKVPTMDTLRSLVPFLAGLKINQLQLYTEHTFAYRNHKAVWDKASPMTAEEILDLDALCRQNHIELVPNQNSFGHMERWLTHEAYRHLAENPQAPGCLNPIDPQSVSFLAELYDELLPNFTSGQFNVGCDETELGKGKTEQACKERGQGRVYLDFLLKIHSLAQQRGKTMQFWFDIIYQHPELIPELPSGMIAMIWGYEADHAYDKCTLLCRQAGVPFYVCPGTSSWNTLIGRTKNMMGNILNAAENGLKNGGVGLLITDWGDFGHWQHLPVSYAGYTYGAALSWSLNANRNINLARVLDQHVFLDQAGVMGQLALDLGNTYELTEVLKGNATFPVKLLYEAEKPVDSSDFSDYKLIKLDPLKNTIRRIDELIARLDQTKMQRPDAAQIVAEFRNNALLARHGCTLGVVRTETKANLIQDIPQDKRRELAADLKNIITEFRRLWLVRNRPGGLDDSVVRLQKILDDYNH
jgi:hexosaminidase